VWSHTIPVLADFLAKYHLRELRLVCPHNVTVVSKFLVCVLSVSGAIFLIIELDRAFEGLIQISSAPFQDAVARIEK
jgi:hypothetical protein